MKSFVLMATAKLTKTPPPLVFTLQDYPVLCPMKLSIVEIVLMQIIGYALLWLWDDYVASYLTIVVPVLILVILLISLIVEWIEPSRIPRRYFVIMGISVLVPIVTGAVFYLINGGQLEWLEGF